MKASNLIGGIALRINNQTVTSYTLALSDAGSRVRMSHADANTVIIPLNATVPFDVGTIIEVSQAGAGLTSVDAVDVGVTVLTRATLSLDTLGAGSVVRLVKVATDTWEVDGDLATA